MSDQINEFDQIFRDRLSGQTVTPPPAVWENIQTTRSFGHVVANRISTNWRIFGTLLMLALAGGSSIVLFGEEESHTNLYTDYNIELINHTAAETIRPTAVNQHLITDLVKSKPNQSTLHLSKTEWSQKAKEDIYLLPDMELLASMQQAGFVKPVLQDERLSAYIESLDGWESAKPIEFVRYFHMDELPSKLVHKDVLSQTPRLSKIDYDYVMPKVERKSFMERSSFLFSFTPQSIRKLMRADYNLASSFLEEREKAEKTRLAYTFGALLHYEVKNHKFIETGVNYTQIYEEVSYEGEKRFSNQYNFLEIPVLLGYEDRNAKWGWEVKGGFGVQIFNTYSGYTLKRVDEFGASDPEPQFRVKTDAVRNIIYNDHDLLTKQARNEVFDLDNKEENPYKTSGVVNLHFASGIAYYHSIKTTFVVTPYFRRSINSITKESARYTEKISYSGISFGARIKF